MQKQGILTGTIILLIGGLITKVLGMVINIIRARYLGLDGLSLYMLIMPTFYLFMTIALLGLPVAISKLVAEEKKRGRHIIATITPFMLLFNLLITLIIIFTSPFISKLLIDERTLYPLISIAFIIPFISISGLIRSYFLGKQQMFPPALANVGEQILKLTLIILITPYLLTKGIIITIVGLIIINLISEIGTIIILTLFLPHHLQIKKDDLKPDLKIIKDSLYIGLPTMGSRLIGALGNFIEPILLGMILIKVGYSNQYFVHEYGIINGYVFPLLFMPSFFIQTIGLVLLPIISKAYAHHQIPLIKRKLKQVLTFALIIGLICNTAFMLKPTFFLQLIYKTTAGARYLRMLAPFFCLYYLQVPLTITLQATNRAHEAMMSTLISMGIKIIIYVSLSFCQLGLDGLIIATITNIIIVTGYNYRKVKKALT